VRMTFLVNTSPFAGREGKYVTSRNIKDRLQRELERNLVRAWVVRLPQSGSAGVVSFLQLQIKGRVHPSYILSSA